MLRDVDWRTVRTVVEYGPGTGIFTRAVMESMQMACSAGPRRVVAIERNPRLAAALVKELAAGQQECNVEVIEGDALDVQQILSSAGAEQADLVVSGLGWPSIPPEPRRMILERTHSVLSSRGQFRTFGYHIGLCMPGAWDFRRTCRRLFASMEISPVVWRNLPPAFVYTCTKQEHNHG